MRKDTVYSVHFELINWSTRITYSQESFTHPHSSCSIWKIRCSTNSHILLWKFQPNSNLLSDTCWGLFCQTSSWHPRCNNVHIYLENHWAYNICPSLSDATKHRYFGKSLSRNSQQDTQPRSLFLEKENLEENLFTLYWIHICVIANRDIYHINCGVIHGFLALRKAVTTFFTCVDIANQLLTRHSPLAPPGQVDAWTAKFSRFSIQVVCRSFL